MKKKSTNNEPIKSEATNSEEINSDLAKNETVKKETADNKPKKKKSISKKIYLTMLSLSLIFGIVICLSFMFQFTQYNADIQNEYLISRKALVGNAKSKLEGLNKQVVSNITAIYGSIVDENYRNVRMTGEAIATFMQDLYGKEGRRDVSEVKNYVSYMPGVNPASSNGELAKIGDIRDYIRSMPGYDPNNLATQSMYVMTESGMYIDGSNEKKSIPELRNAPWYLGAKESGKVFWTDPFDGFSDGVRKITCGVPFYDANGKFMGVAGVDLPIDHLYETILPARSEQIKHALILDQNGQIIINPDNYSLEGIEQREGVCVQNEGFVSFAQIPEKNWTLCVVFEFDLVKNAMQGIQFSIDQTGRTTMLLMNNAVTRFVWICFLILLGGSLVVILVSRWLASSMVKPINKLAKDVDIIGSGNLDYRITGIKTGDEIQMLAISFNEMSVRLQEYMENLSAVTSEKERIGAELNVATQIQADMLPSIFPAFPERSEFDIYASMEPAKEVGGDFYDFFLIDQDRLAFIIADVSGKGVPAALFMVIAKTLIKNHAQLGLSPAEVFNATNSQLCENNEAGLFVTAWLGILEISTGKLIYVNAGHNPPLLKHKDGSFEYLKCKSGFVLAGMEDLKYNQFEMELGKGDILFLYTDGVTESNDIAGNLYGDDRLLDVLNNSQTDSLNQILAVVRQDIDDFAQEAPQFDDITMLGLKIN